MIEVILRHKESGVELGRIEIENLSEDPEAEYGDYLVQFGVEKIGSVGLHKRPMTNFPRRKYNVLGLLRQALATLEPRDLELDGNYEDRTYKKTFLQLGRNFL